VVQNNKMAGVVCGHISTIAFGFVRIQAFTIRELPDNRPATMLLGFPFVKA